jgi:hypothetical protein
LTATKVHDCRMPQGIGGKSGAGNQGTPFLFPCRTGEGVVVFGRCEDGQGRGSRYTYVASAIAFGRNFGLDRLAVTKVDWSIVQLRMEGRLG